MEEKKKNYEKLIRSTAENVTDLVDVNTVIGQPITTPSGFHIIPFTKVTVGRLAGSGEYGETKIVNDDNTKAGAAGVFIHIKPEGFLVDDGTTCRLLNVTNDPASALVEKATEIISSIADKA